MRGRVKVNQSCPFFLPYCYICYFFYPKLNEYLVKFTNHILHLSLKLIIQVLILIQLKRKL